MNKMLTCLGSGTRFISVATQLILRTAKTTLEMVAIVKALLWYIRERYVVTATQVTATAMAMTCEKIDSGQKQIVVRAGTYFMVTALHL